MKNESAAVEAVARYDMAVVDNGMHVYVESLETELGDYVRYDDHQSALDALRGEVERLENLCLALEAQAEENFSKYAESSCRVAELEAVLRPLADANFAEFCGEGTEANEPDDSKVSFPEDRCHITFGMIRRARAALTKESP